MSDTDRLSSPFLPYGRQTIEDDDVAAISEAIRADYLTTGPTVSAFDRAFAAAVDARFAHCCNSGTAALHLALMALNIGEGDVVIVPSMTFLASANAARFQGARVFFADVDPETGLLTPETFQAALDRAGGRAKAVVVVHLNGQSADMESIAVLARTKGIAIVEDACHALGALQIGRDGRRHKVGSCAFSDLACFSLHPVKGMTTAEGGVVSTQRLDLAARIEKLRSHGMNRDAETFEDGTEAFDPDGTPRPWYYEMSELGWNYRLPDVLCALGLSQLAKVDRFIAKRQQLAAAYDEGFRIFSNHARPVPSVHWSTNAYHLYVAQIDFEALGITRARFAAKLRERGIGSQVHYFPVHRQPYYRRHGQAVSLPGADRYYARCLSLPLFPTMTVGDVERVLSEIGAAIGAAHQ